jgi:3-hydroxyisobutyrate dehydrogenase-like beta-hydroxyacid dehydrogenase
VQLKLVNQLLVACHVAAACEAAAALRHLEIDPATAERVLTGGWGASAMLSRCLPRALGEDHGDGGARIGLMVEVQRLLANMIGDMDIDTPVVRAARALFEEAEAEGLGESDLSAIVDVIDRSGRP